MKRGQLMLLIAICFCILGCKRDKTEASSLNDYLPLTDGCVWKYSYGSDGGHTDTLTHTIMEKGISRSINGRTFNDVIHTKVEVQYDYGTGFQTFVTYDFYLAKGVGLIESDSNTLDSFFETETLFEYTIK